MTTTNQDERAKMQFLMSKRARAWLKWWADTEKITVGEAVQRLVQAEAKRCKIDGAPAAE